MPRRQFFIGALLTLWLVFLVGCTGLNRSTAPVQVSVKVSGDGTGTVSSSPAGIDCGSTCQATFSPGTEITLTAQPTGSSTFTGWAGACSGTSTCRLAPDSNTSVTATFSLAGASPVLSVSLEGAGSGTVTSNPSGIDCGSVCSASFDGGTQVTLGAAPSSGATFGGWGGACSGTGSCVVTLSKDTSVTATFNLTPVLTVTLAGTGQGTVVSSPAGIDCGQTCTAGFPSGSQVTLTATPASNSTFAGWAGAGCSGDDPTCVVTLHADAEVTATFNASQGVGLLNHIVFLAQENRSFDQYFGELRQYWKDNGYADQSFDGLPQFNPTSGEPPLYGPPPSIPGCDPNAPPPSDCVFDPQNPVTSYHLITQCTENTSPSWNEAHVDWDYNDPLGNFPATLDGFVHTAAHDARTNTPPFQDSDGIRAMGYYDGGDLNYYYFMASNFATSDRWFHPAMTRTHPNREYLIAGTSQGHAYPLNGDGDIAFQGQVPGSSLLTATTIFQELQDAGISWKIYVNPQGSHCSGPPYDPACLLKLSYVQNFQWGQTIPTQYPNNIAPISQYFTDLQNGTLPQVAQIEPASDAGLDEHPSNSDSAPSNIQKGANYVSTLINGLMNSSSWKDSAFILTFDEFGGLYDHVAPVPTVSPDGIKPNDLKTGDICNKGVTGPLCDFTYTGYRVPLIVVSPYTRKNYVSHTVADMTAILKLIETRFNVSALTQRDSAQMDMTEFFDFDNPAWMTPPAPPAQNLKGACYLDHLP